MSMPPPPPPPKRRRRRARRLLLLLLLVVVMGATGVGLHRLLSGPRVRVEQESWLELRLAGDYPEERPVQRGLAAVLQPEVLSAQDLGMALRRAADDPRIRGVLLEPDGYGGGWAQAQEIRQALAKLRDAGKRVLAFVSRPGAAAYYLACAADSIAVAPEGGLFILGLQARLTYLKGTLDKLGVSADFVAIGEFKSAPEQLTRTSASESSRRQTEVYLDDVYSTWLDALATARHIGRDRMQEHVDTGYFPADRAVEAGLADAVRDRRHFLAAAGLDPDDPRTLQPLEYLRAPLRRGRVDGSRRLALIYAAGEIHTGESSRGGLTGSILGSSTLIDRLGRARRDDSVKAVVLRVDSPGGAVLASDLIWREIQRLRAEKPVVVSMGNLAASGGYYLAMSGDRIFADPLTLTGSIGVFTGKLDLAGLYEKLGLSFEVLERGRNAGYFSDLTPFTPEQRRQTERHLREFYARFLERVAEGRGLTVEEVDAAARGRIWSGRRALAAGLVDTLGTLSDALQAAKSLAGIEPDVRVPVLTYQRRPGILARTLRSLLRQGHLPQQALSAAGWAALPGLSTLQAFLRVLDGTPQFRLPWILRIE